MERSSRVFFLVISVLIAGSVVVTYYRFFVARDYLVQAQADCDPYTEACFVYVCDPLEEEGCTGDLLEDTSYHKLIDRLARNVPLCEADEETCIVLPCATDETECSYTLCDAKTVEEGEVCSDPNTYTREHPGEEEESEAGTNATVDEMVPDEEAAAADDTESDQ